MTATARYRNTVYAVGYCNQATRAEVYKGATELATLAIGKAVPDQG